MTKLANRLVRRLDDGRIVYRLHIRAKAVVLNEAEYQFVEHLLLRKVLVVSLFGIGILFSTLLSLHSYNRGIVSPILLVAFLAPLMVLAIIAEKRLMARLTAVLDAAPISTEDQFEVVPSQLEAFHLVLRGTLQNAPSVVIWSLVINFAGYLFASLFVLVKQIEGKDPTTPDTHPAILVAVAVISGLCLRTVFRERQR